MSSTCYDFYVCENCTTLHSLVVAAICSCYQHRQLSSFSLYLKRWPFGNHRDTERLFKRCNYTGNTAKMKRLFTLPRQLIEMFTFLLSLYNDAYNFWTLELHTMVIIMPNIYIQINREEGNSNFNYFFFKDAYKMNVVIAA